MIFRPIDVVQDKRWGDEQVRSRYSIETFRKRESDSVMDTFYYYWEAIGQGGNAASNFSNFRPFEVFPSSMVSRISWVETSDPNPENFILRNHCGGAMLSLYGSMEGTRLGDYPNRMHRDATMAEYQLCKQLRRPLYHEFNQILAGIPRHYRRILMPLLNERGEVVRIAYSFRTISVFPPTNA